MEEKGTQTASGSVSTAVHDRIKGAVFGAACANSLGGSTIGLNYKEIAATTGLSGLQDFAPGLSRSALPDHQPGELLADALMFLSLSESLIENKGRFNAVDLKRRFGRLLEDRDFLKASPGVPCLKGLRRLVDGEKPADDAAEALHANVASRACLLGCLPGGKKSDEPLDIAVSQARLSHADGRAIAAAGVIADSVRYFVNGGQMESAEDVKNYVRLEYEIASKLDERFAESWDDVAPDLDYANPAEELPYSLINVESSVTELVPTAVGIFLIFRHNPEQAIMAAARSGGDTDTVAAIVGALAGAYHGASKLPERWLSKISQKERLDSVAQGYIGLWA